MLKRESNSSVWGLLLAVFAAILALSAWVGFVDGSKKFDELALGKYTSTLFGKVDGVSIHCGDVYDMHKCISGYEEGKKNKDVILWLGNSQLHAINQYKSGDQTASMLLHDRLSDVARYLITFSQANANLEEHSFILQKLHQKLPISTLVLPVFFDDMRESGIRKSVLKMDQYDGLEQLKSETIATNFQGKAGIVLESHGIQQKVESKLDKIVSTGLDFWSNRDSLRGEILNYLYLLRNKVFNISASTKRRKIEGRYATNLGKFKEILGFSLQNKINVVVYIPPIRNDVEIPYDLEEYNDFKDKVGLLSREYGADFFILEDLVPGKYWGSKRSTSLGDDGYELDFMHFQSGGHEILSDRIYQLLSSEVLN